MGGTPSKSEAPSSSQILPPPKSSQAPSTTTPPTISDSGGEISGIIIASLGGVLLISGIGLYAKRTINRGH